MNIIFLSCWLLHLLKNFVLSYREVIVKKKEIVVYEKWSHPWINLRATLCVIHYKNRKILAMRTCYWVKMVIKWAVSKIVKTYQLLTQPQTYSKMYILSHSKHFIWFVFFFFKIDEKFNSNLQLFLFFICLVNQNRNYSIFLFCKFNWMWNKITTTKH